MKPSDNPRVFHGPPLPLDSPPVSGPAVAFAAEEQPGGSQEGAAMTPFERFITRLVVQVKQGATFTAEELHRHMSAFASKAGVRFTPDEMHGVMACFSSHEVAPATVTFSTSAEEQPRDDRGRYQEQPRDSHMQERYRGEALTPEYRRHILGYSALGRQILKDEDAAGRIGADRRT